jgi:S1-C subfamily serine protease
MENIKPNVGTRAHTLFPAMVIGCCVIYTPFHARGDDAKNLVAVANELRGQIVQIVVPQQDNKASLGSGFWVNDDGYVATCWHVVQQNPGATIIVRSSVDSFFDLKHGNIVDANWVPFQARVVAHDVNNDIAVLKTEPNPFKMHMGNFVVIDGHELKSHFKHAVIDDDLPQAGQKILLAGYPLGLPYPVVQEGTVASIASNLPSFGPHVKILLSMIANHGNSGGPGIDSDGKVIGLLEAEEARGERTGLEVVVPAQFLSVLMDTVHNETPPPPPGK